MTPQNTPAGDDVPRIGTTPDNEPPAFDEELWTDRIVCALFFAAGFILGVWLV